MFESQLESGRDSRTCGHYSKSVDAATWWDAHFEQAAHEVVEFLGGDNISMEGKRVADVGCGDGIIDLGLMFKAKPKKLVGFDIQDTDVEALTARAAAATGLTSLPEDLYFATSQDAHLPADDDCFDVIVSWSAFEHIADPRAVLQEIRRVLTAEGVLFIQLWPFYASAHGTHLVDWFPSGLAQYLFDDDEIVRTVRKSGDQRMAAEMLEIYRTLNKITVDDLHAALNWAGFKVVKVELTAETVHIPDEARDVPLSQVAISGVKLLAIPDPDAEPAEESEVPANDADQTSRSQLPG